MDGYYNIFGVYHRGINLIAADDYVMGGSREYYLYNGHGYVVRLMDAGGGVRTYDYDYDAFGVEHNPDPYDTNPFRYCGEYWDAETGTYYLRARYYDPHTGRFISEDPIRDGLNWYTYCGGNPVMFVDPWGLDYIIAWSYGGEEVAAFNEWLYITGLTKTPLSGTDSWTAEIWDEFDKRSSFARAAHTRKNGLIAIGIPEDEIHMRRIDSSADLESAWADWAKIAVVEGLDFYSHGSGEGPEVRLGTDISLWDRVAVLNWTSTMRTLTTNGQEKSYINFTYAAFHGCNTANGEFAQSFANRQGVDTFGSTNFTSFSTNANFFSPITTHNPFTPVYLSVYNKISIFGITIFKANSAPMKRFKPIKK